MTLFCQSNDAMSGPAVDADLSALNGGTGCASPMSRRELAAAIAVLLLATLACFHELARHPDLVLVGPQKRGHNDLIDYFIGSREYAAHAVTGEGELPHWNPHLCLGLPHTGNPQAALWYPPNWLTLVWDASKSLSWLLVAHHLFGGLGVYWLARRYGLSWSAATLGGVIFLGAPYLIAQTAEGHYPQIAAVAWTPWTLLAYSSLRARTINAAGTPETKNPLADVAPFAFCLAMSFLAGHAQETYYLVLLLSGCLLTDCVLLWRRGRRKAARGLMLNWVRLGMATCGLVAVDLFPAYLNTRLTLRPSLREMNQEFGVSALEWSSLRELWNPFALTRPEAWVEGAVPFWEKVCHFGVLPLLLAGVGVLLAWRRAPTRRMAAIWMVTLLFAFGSLTPVYPTLAAVVPGITWFRLPSRALFFTSFATTMLAAIALNELMMRARNRWPAAAVPVQVLSLLMIVACVAELTRFADAVTDTAGVRSLAERDPELLGLLKDAQNDVGAQRVLAFQDILSDRDAAAEGLLKLRGYEPAGPAAYLLLMAQLQETHESPFEPMDFFPTDVRHLNRKLLDLLAVRHAIQLREPGRTADVPEGWRRVHSGQIVESVRRSGSSDGLYYSYDLLENETALPRAFVVGQVRELSGLSDFKAALPDLDFREQVVLDKDVLPDGARAAFAPARFVRDDAGSIELIAELDAPGYLVLSDLWYPGWSARIGDQALPILKANGSFRAVPLPAGRHHVVMWYEPRGFLAGAVLTAATLLGLVISLLASRLSVCRRDSIAPIERSRQQGTHAREAVLSSASG